jgi:hypothetical protein
MMQLRPVNLAVAALIGVGLGVVSLVPTLEPFLRSIQDSGRGSIMVILFVRVFGLAIVLVAVAAAYNWWLARKQNGAGGQGQ